METVTTEKKVAEGHDLAKAQMIQYFDLQDLKKGIDDKMKVLKAELNQFGEVNKDLFVDGQYTFDCCGYLRRGNETTAKLTKTFNLSKFNTAFKGAVKKQFHFSFLKALFKESPKAAEKAKKLGFTLTSKPKFDIVKAGEEFSEPSNE